MSTQLHPTFHRHNHHTRVVDITAYPDSAHDPIASYDKPFQGDFVCNGRIDSTDSDLNYNLKHDTLALLVSSQTIAINADGDAMFNGNLSTGNITIRDEYFNNSKMLTTADISKYWVLYINNKAYGIRLWEEPTSISIKGVAPHFLSICRTDVVLSDHIGNASELIAHVRGTNPIKLQWFRSQQIIKEEQSSILYCEEAGMYQCVATNAYGTATLSVSVT